MSVVTSVILQMSCAEDGFVGDDTSRLDKINAFLASSKHPPLTDLTPHMGGNRHPQTYVFGGGYNHFFERKFSEFIMRFDWKRRANVVLVMNPEAGPTRVWLAGAKRFFDNPTSLPKAKSVGRVPFQSNEIIAVFKDQIFDAELEELRIALCRDFAPVSA